MAEKVKGHGVVVPDHPAVERTLTNDEIQQGLELIAQGEMAVGFLSDTVSTLSEMKSDIKDIVRNVSDLKANSDEIKDKQEQIIDLLTQIEANTRP